ncbi:MAG: cytochrome c [Flavitalea sp.]
MINNSYAIKFPVYSLVCICLLALFSCNDNDEAGSVTAFNDEVVVPALDTTQLSKHDTTRWAGSDVSKWPASFAIGQVATQEEISRIDIDIMPDGRGLPQGSGNASDGRKIYLLKCAACHGQTGKEGPNNKLVATMTDTSAEKAIGNYWPYATTVFDYIRRAMPYNAPGSLSNKEVYHLTAYLLAANNIIDSSSTLTAEKLARIKMPAHSLFIADDRRGGPEVK